MVHLAGALLANRSGRSCPVSASLVSLAAVSNRRYRGRRSFETRVGYRDAAGATGEFTWPIEAGCLVRLRI